MSQQAVGYEESAGLSPAVITGDVDSEPESGSATVAAPLLALLASRRDPGFHPTAVPVRSGLVATSRWGRGRRARSIFGVLSAVVSAGVLVGVIVHVCGESGLEPDDHLRYLLVLMLVAVATLALSLALLLPRPPDGR